MAGVVVVNQPPVTLYDSSGNEIGPAKETTLATRASEATLATRATEATLATRASEATLEAARLLLVALEGKDFATQTTLATRSSEATLEAARVLLVSLDGKDFATQATLATRASEATLATRASEATLEASRVLLASLDGKDFATETTQVALGVILSALETKVATEATLATRATEATLASRASETTLASIKDTAGIKKITDPLPAGTNEVGKAAQGTKGLGTNAWPVQMYDGAGNPVTITDDAGVYRVEITGKVQTVGAIPPPSTTPVQVSADTPLSVGTHDTTFLIPTGETFYLQSITAGNEDPTKGAVTEVIYDNGTEHLIERVYTAGQTITIGFPDLDNARDGTLMVGTGTETIIVRRTKYSGSNIAIDSEIRGYTV